MRVNRFVLPTILHPTKLLGYTNVTVIIQHKVANNNVGRLSSSLILLKKKYVNDEKNCVTRIAVKSPTFISSN
jgi:hypothetical protein